MKGIGIALVAFALILNMTFASVVDFQTDEEGTATPEAIPGGTGGGPIGGGGIGNETFNTSSISTVTVPGLRIYDRAKYDHRIYLEWYWTNESSGEWHSVELIGLADTIERVGNVRSEQDGFFEDHDTVERSALTIGSLEIVYTNSTGGSLSKSGDLNMDRAEHWDIENARPIAVMNDVEMSIGGLGEILGLPGGVIDASFEGTLRSWPDLTRDHTPSLEDETFGLGQELEVNVSKGQIPQYGDYGEWLPPYNWTAEPGLVIEGYNTMLVNITSDFWGLPYQKMLWVSNNMSMPAMMYDSISYNDTYEHDGYTFSEHMILENEKILQPDGWSQGEIDVQWGADFGDPTPQGTYKEKSEHGEFEDWHDSSMPAQGDSYDSSSFYFSTDEAVEAAYDLSGNFSEFSDAYPDMTVEWGETNATFTDLSGIAGEFWWEIGFFHKATEEETEEAYEEYNTTGEVDAPWKCRMQIKKTVENIGSPLSPEYETTYEIINDTIYDSLWTSWTKNKYSYDADALTMAGFENIMALDPLVKDTCFDGNELRWNHDPAFQSGDDYAIGTSLNVGDEGADGFMDMTSMLTGLTMPSSEFQWTHMYGWMGTDGESTSASVNAENGQLIGVMNQEGTPWLSLLTAGGGGGK